MDAEDLYHEVRALIEQHFDISDRADEAIADCCRVVAEDGDES